MKKAFVIIAVSLLLCFSLYAEKSIYDVTASFDDSVRERIINGETVVYYSVNGDYVPDIAFDGTEAEKKAVEDASLDNTLTSAIAVLVPYPDSWEDMSYSEKKLEIINTLLSISTIKGITYISHSAGDKPKVLFSDAYTLTSTNKGKKAYDVAFSYAPDKYSYNLAAYLKDNIFGGNTYSIDYEIAGDEIFMTITNVSKLKFLFFTAVKEGELDLCVDCLMTKEGIAIFGLATVRGAEEYVETPVTDVHLPTAFIRRVTSLKDWFIKEINN